MALYFAMLLKGRLRVKGMNWSGSIAVCLLLAVSALIDCGGSSSPLSVPQSGNLIGSPGSSNSVGSSVGASGSIGASSAGGGAGSSWSCIVTIAQGTLIGTGGTGPGVCGLGTAMPPQSTCIVTPPGGQAVGGWCIASPASSVGAPTSSGGCSLPGASPYAGKALVWDDEFTYTGALDATKWKFGQLGPAKQNGEIEVYTNAPANAHVGNCMLTLTALYANGSYTSARINSLQSWQYGRFDIMAKLPCGQGTWPALWMMPQNSVYGGWPASGELDIMELSNTHPNSTTVLGTVHTKKSGGGGTNKTIQVPTDCNAFHLYSMDWKSNQIQILVDNVAYNTYGPGINLQDSTVWPFNQPFYFIFNIAVGGILGGKPDPTAYPQTMEIQYVRVYQ